MDASTLFKLTHGVYIVGVEDPNKKLCGCVVDALMQATVTPLGIELCTNKNSYTSYCIENSREFTVSILGQDADPKIIAKFGLNSARDINKWEGVDYELLGNLPVLKKCLGSFKVKVFHKLELSTHILWSCEITETINGENKTPLTYGFYREHISQLAQKAQNGEDVKPYNATETAEIKQDSDKYCCGVCGYVYDGEIPFEELPDDWTCPSCCCGKEVFAKL
jgi:flavin reductase (DIM6/NTAB) family NADH-FMN oxidoreductase RutF/rubredoxin